MRDFRKKIVGVGFVFILTLFFVFLQTVGLQEGKVEAADDNFFYGYAWSDNIGWLSFNCENTNSCDSAYYKVRKGDNGVMSGYAWSDNVGWVSFNRGDLTGCPSGECEAKLSSDSLTGWGRVLSYDKLVDSPSDPQRDLRWDGWVSLDCGTAGVCATSNYGITLNNDTKIFSGYAWGDKIVGWMNFASVVFGDPNNIPSGADTPWVSLVANPLTVSDGGSTNLTWTSDNLASCTASGDWSGNKAVSNDVGESVGPISGSATYEIECVGDNGDVVSDTVSVFVANEDFSISGTPTSLTVRYLGSGGKTNKAVVARVSPRGGFNDDVTLSLDTTNIEGAPLSLVDLSGDSIISESEYRGGVSFKIFVDLSGGRTISRGPHTVVVKGTSSGGEERFFNVRLTARKRVTGGTAD